MKGELTVKKLFFLGGALFSMHFGASCMLYPVTWGKESGSKVFIAFLGVLVSGLILPLLAYVAMSRANGSFREITCRFAPRFGRFFCLGTVILLGPLFVIPRMSAASWDAIIQFTGWQTCSKLPIILFDCIYYTLTYWFVSNKGKTMERVGKILFPILIVIVSCIIIKGIITPLSDAWIEPTYDKSPFIYGFLEGYATADLLCAMLYGLVVVSGLKNAGVSQDNLNLGIVKVGIIGMSILCLAHIGHMIVGANTGGTIQLSYAMLYTEVVRSLLGNTGGILFCIALTASALTTASGLTGSTAVYIEDATSGKFSYRQAAILTCILSTVISSIGLDAIVTMITPVLNLFYPGVIIMVIYFAFIPKFNDKNKLFALSFAFYGATACGILDMMATYNSLFGINSSIYCTFYSALPLSSDKLTWVPISTVCFFAGLLIYKIKNNKLQLNI